MALVINSNIASLNAQRQIEKSNNQLSTAMERLSSGSRINRAADDASGLSISTRMSSQINGLNSAIRNANDGKSLIQTAEGALETVTNILSRMKDLATRAGGVTNQARQDIQAEMSALREEINSISERTNFNGQKLLDGSFLSKFQVGAASNDNLQIGIDAMDSKSLGGAASSVSVTANSSGALQDGELSINGVEIDHTTATTTQKKVEAINAATGETGVQATTGSVQLTTDVSALVPPSGGTGTNINVVANSNIKINGEVVALTDDANYTATLLVGDINAETAKTGVTASLSGTTLTLTYDNTAVADRGIQIESGTTSDPVTDKGFKSFSFSSVNQNGETTTETLTLAEGVDVANLQLSSTNGNRIDIGVQAGSSTSSATGLSGNTLDAIDVTTSEGAQTAQAVLDGAIDEVSSQRADLGALSNRLDFNISNLMNIRENTEAARSRILDADFAAETASLSRARVLQQASQAMLAQANAQPNQVLQLLNG